MPRHAPIALPESVMEFPCNELLVSGDLKDVVAELDLPGSEESASSDSPKISSGN